jgi:hypothetical protein
MAFRVVRERSSSADLRANFVTFSGNLTEGRFACVPLDAATLSRCNPYFNKEFHREENIADSCYCSPASAIRNGNTKRNGFNAYLPARWMYRPIALEQNHCGLPSEKLISGQPMLLLRWYLFIAPSVLLGCCAFFLWRQRLHRIYPVFGAYVGFQLLQFIVLFITDLLVLPSITSLATYRWVLVVGTGIAAVLQVGVLYELTSELLLSRSWLANSLRPLLRWSLALALLIAAGSSALFP